MEVLTRTYTYTGQSAWVAGSRKVPLSAFTMTGDARPVTQLLSIKISYYRWQRTSSTVTHTAQLIFANGSETITSNGVSCRGDEEVFHITNVFSAMPVGSDWLEDNVTIRTWPNSKTDKVFWQATASRPMVITITYYSSEFKPSLSALRLYRADEMGAAKDLGVNLTFSAKLAVEDTGTSGTGKLEIFAGDTSGADASGTLIYSASNLTVSTAGITLSQAPIPDVTIPIANLCWFYFLFTYTAQTQTGVTSTETASALMLVGRTFVNMHLSPCSTGGVAIGKYSGSTEGNPLFECMYPATFGGKVRFDGGAEGLLDYSTSDSLTGGTWIDGKPIYRCVIEVGAKTANSMYLDVSSLAIETYIDLRGMFYATADYGDGYVYPAPYVAMSTSYLLGVEAASRTSIRINSSSRTWQSGFVVLEYTKTTDT